MKKIIKLTEQDLVKIIKKVLKEDELNLPQAKIYNNPDYTITVVRADGKGIKMKLSGSLAGVPFEINPIGLKNGKDGGIELLGRDSKKWSSVDSDAVKDIIKFAESNQKQLVISRKFGTTKIFVEKI